jgi:ATP-dependent Clp protease protease subunit
MKLKQIVLPGRPKARTAAKKPFKLDAKALGEGYEIAIYGEISCDDGAAMAFRDHLTRADGKAVSLLINSEGGDIFEGLAIYNEMLAYPGEITVKVMGVAGSAASIIAMGGDRIEIAPNAQMMIHQAWVGCAGNAGDLRDMADTLDSIDASLIETYVARTGQSEDVIRPMVEAETWMRAQQCVELGFADAVLEFSARPMASARQAIGDHAARVRAARQRLGKIAAKSLQPRTA